MSHKAYKATPAVCAAVMAYHRRKRELIANIKRNRYDLESILMRRAMLRKPKFCESIGISERLYDYIVARNGELKENVRRRLDPHQGFNASAGI